VEAGTPAPSARAFHAMTVVGQQIFLYGGYYSGSGDDDAPVYLGDLWVWSTVDHKWTEVEAGTPAPSARCDHAMTVVGQQIFLYGGNSDGVIGE
jgi:N-acetylneuraminic acid mutarotase